jgi:hypothetical protein
MYFGTTGALVATTQSNEYEVGSVPRVRHRAGELQVTARASLAVVYVGQTAKTPEQRFDEHKRGVNAATVVRKHGLRLRPDLYEREPLTITREEAERLERRLARKLRARGYSVRSNGELPALGREVGPCPACGCPVLVSNRVYSCGAATRTGCGFQIPASKAGRALPLSVVRDLIRLGRTEAPIDRVKGARGFFSAHLFLKQDVQGKWRVEIERRSASTDS